MIGVDNFWPHCSFALSLSSKSIGFFFTRLFSEIKNKLPGKPGKFQNLPGLEIPGFTFLEKSTRLTFYPAFLIFWEITRFEVTRLENLPGCILPGFCQFLNFYPAAHTHTPPLKNLTYFWSETFIFFNWTKSAPTLYPEPSKI